MSAIIYKQPNGRFCRYSTICDAVTDYNMTDYDIIKMFVMEATDKAVNDARRFLSNERNLHDFEELCKKFEEREELELPGEMPLEEFNKLKEKMSKPADYLTFWMKM